MPSIATLTAATIPFLGVIFAAYRYFHTPKAAEERVDDLETRLEDAEDALREMQQLLTGADADADPGILIELQDSIEDVRSELSEIRREMQKQDNEKENT